MAEKKNRRVNVVRASGGPELSIGRRIKDKRRDADLSLRGLADLAGLAPTTLQNYESGERIPGAKELRKLSSALGRSVDWLVTGKEWTGELSAESADFFGEVADRDEYPFRLVAAMRALPESDRNALHQVISSVLRAKVGSKRLERIKGNASQMRFRFIEAVQEPTMMDVDADYEAAMRTANRKKPPE